nr:hypothetical protein [Tanacetum cinerariifolium]
MIDQGVNTAIAARDANRTGDDSHTSGTGVRRTERVTRECTYQDFMKCQHLYFKGTEGVVELSALTWWNSHVRIVGSDAAYSVAASKPKTMQEATEMATGLMNKKIRTMRKGRLQTKGSLKTLLETTKADSSLL